MNKSRKPKGSEGGDLQIRNLDAETLQNLQELKEYFRVGTNSKAVLLAIKKFMPYMREVQELRRKQKKAEESIKEQWQLFAKIRKVLDEAHHDKMISDILGFDEDDVMPLP